MNKEKALIISFYSNNISNLYDTMKCWKKKFLLNQINKFSSSPFLCELLKHYTIDEIILYSQHDEEFLKKNMFDIYERFQSIELHRYKSDKINRFNGLNIRLLLLEKV